MSPEQITLLFTEGLLTTRDRALFGVCLYTACRINEACTLLTADVMGIKGIRDKILIRSINTKGKQDTREIQIHPKLKDYLEAYQPDIKKEHLFPGRHYRGHIHKASADKILREACKRVGLEGVSTHSFRRTALTQMHNAGVPMRHIQSISGHRTLAALARYLDVTDEQSSERDLLSQLLMASPLPAVNMQYRHILTRGEITTGRLSVGGNSLDSESRNFYESLTQ